MPKMLSADEALKVVKSFDSVFIHSVASTPQKLIESLVKRAPELTGVKIYHIHTEGNCDYARPELENSFQVYSFFNGSNMRKARGERIAETYVPIFLSEIPLLFYNGHVNLDVALIQVSPPDEHGMCSLGPSIDVSIAAVRTAKTIIAQVNPQMPRTFGEQVPFKDIHFTVDVNEPLHELSAKALTDCEKKIGLNIAGLIEDGATLQMGIGSIPNAVLECLHGHKDLGIHTEMFSDGLIPLVEKGVITGKYKVKHPTKIVSSFIHGSKKVYDFINNNTQVLLLDCAYTNNTHIIAQNPKVTAINSAVEVDLTGQICADSIGSRIYSGVGGQMDFIRGAALSRGGKPIIALPSTTTKGESKIQATLKLGAGVVTTRAHAHYVVTEHGVAYLHGKSLRERADALIKIAAPEHRERLEREIFQIFKKL